MWPRRRLRHPKGGRTGQNPCWAEQQSRPACSPSSRDFLDSLEVLSTPSRCPALPEGAPRQPPAGSDNLHCRTLLGLHSRVVTSSEIPCPRDRAPTTATTSPTLSQCGGSLVAPTRPSDQAWRPAPLPATGSAGESLPRVLGCSAICGFPRLPGSRVKRSDSGVLSQDLGGPQSR